MKKLIKSKRGFVFTAAAFIALLKFAPIMLGLVLFGIPVFGT